MLQNRETFEALVYSIIKNNTPVEVQQWLDEKAGLIKEEKTAATLNLAFVTLPRKTGRKVIVVQPDEQQILSKLLPGFTMDGWTIDKLSRLWLLMQVSTTDKTAYISKIENLFQAAEMNELVALYASLPVLAYPEDWRLRCSEGIRSNIGNVLEAIMYNNPYPAQYLNDPAWNQLVLKAFFTDKNINFIVGIDDRANNELASVLIDYAHERWAAHRTVNPLLWRLVAPFVNETNFSNIERIFAGSDETEKNAAALACVFSNYSPAKQLLSQQPALEKDILEKRLSWSNIETHSSSSN